MNRSRATTIQLFVALLLLPALAAGDQVADEAAIREIVRRVEAGWNAHSGEAFAGPFAEDADYVNVRGMHVEGRPAIAAGHQEIFDTIYKESRNTGTVQSIRFLRPDVAVAHVRWHLRFTSDGAPVEAEAVNTMVLTKGRDGWSIAAFHNTPIRSPEPPPSPATPKGQG